MMKLLSKTLNYTFLSRTLHTSPLVRLKEISVEKSGNTTIIEGKFVPSPRESHLLTINDPEKQKACPVCKLGSLGMEITHTDVLILSQFIRSDGCMLPKRVTGLCNRQQKRIAAMVSMAHKAGLMSNFNPPQSNRDPSRRKEHKKFNTYFDEATIEYPFRTKDYKMPTIKQI